MSYSITAHSRARAKSLGVIIRRAKNKKKKLDVFKIVNKKEKKVATIGAIGYGDFGTFKRTKGIEFANKRRTAYKKRHAKNRSVAGSNGYYADKILW